MSESSADQAFVLRPDVSHLGDDEFDAQVVKFPGWEDAYGLALSKRYELPERISFEANFRSLAVTDYPVNDMHWPIMSTTMLQTLESVGDFLHQSHPVVMVKDTVMSEDRYDRDGTARPGVEDGRFVVVQLLEHHDYFDWERSSYERSRRVSTLVRNIQRLALKPKESPYPPLFRLTAYPAPLFISSAGRLALERAGVRGVDYEAIDDFQG